MRYVIREKFFRLGEDSDITDEAGNPVYHVDGKVFSLHGKLTVTDPQGNEVAKVQRKLMALLPTYEISIGGEEVQMKKKFFTPFHDEFHIDLPGPDDLDMVGNFTDHEYQIRQGDTTIATVSRRWLTLTETYGVDIAPGQNDALILATVLALDLAEDRAGSS